jgi:hypothetical protein
MSERRMYLLSYLSERRRYLLSYLREEEVSVELPE